MSTAHRCPEEVLKSIPHYPSEISPELRGAIEAHAADCAACRDEIAFLRGDEEPPNDLPDPQRVYERVLERIGASDEEIAPHTLRRRGSRGLRPAAIAAGIAIAALAGGLGGYGVRWLEQAVPRYETASALPAVSAADGALIEVVFRGDATADEIRAGLRAIEGSVVSGPSALGVYRVRLAPGGDVPAALDTLRGESGSVASFAEPSAG